MTFEPLDETKRYVKQGLGRYVHQTTEFYY